MRNARSLSPASCAIGRSSAAALMLRRPVRNTIDKGPPFATDGTLSDEERASPILPQVTPSYSLEAQFESSSRVTCQECISPSSIRRRVVYPFLGNSGCMQFVGAILGSCGGCILSPKMVCVGAVCGALSADICRRTCESNRRSHQDDRSEEGSGMRGVDLATIERHTVRHVSRGSSCRSLSHDSASTRRVLSLRSSASPSIRCDDESSKCMICREAFAKGDQLRTLPCVHMYHRHCIDAWLSRSAQCPICKHDITDITEIAKPAEPAVLRKHVREFGPVARIRRAWRSRSARAVGPGREAGHGGRELHFREALARCNPGCN